MIAASIGLTQEQQDYVWRYVCARMTDEDENPLEVVNKSYGGEREKYLQRIAEWHSI